MTNSTFESISSTDFILVNWVRDWPVGQFDYEPTPIQTSNFSCTEPNPYIKKTLINFYAEFCTFPIFVMRTQLALIFWNKTAGKEGRYVFSLFLLLDVHKPPLYALFRIWNRWDRSGLESGQSGGVPRDMFLRNGKKEMKLEETGRAIVMLISNNRWQFKPSFKASSVV